MKLFFLFWEFSTKVAEHFVFHSVKPQPFVFILPCLASRNLRVVLVGTGVSDAVLISLSSDDCFSVLF